ncbi:MAG: hypothetical protein NTU58_00255 [Candidatus Nealsonbacteria bacterium]|nr:hypothetical protein [Candidatus Nealsonbacteria bacterium]
MKKINILEIIFVVILIAIGITLRLLPHLPNFTPIIAIALFGGVYLKRKAAVVIPLLTMAVSDMFIGRYELSLMISVYGTFFICVLLGFWLKNNKKWYTILGCTLLGSVLFFTITNFAVWIFTPWYAKTVFGLIQCYLMALPFFRNALLGDLFYVITFFGAYEIVEAWIRIKFKVTKIIDVVHY